MKISFRTLLPVMMVAFGFSGCGEGSGNGGDDRLFIAVEAPAEIEAQHPHSLYQVLVTSSDRSQVWIAPAVPTLESREGTLDHYSLPIETEVSSAEVLVIFRYVTEASANSDQAVVLSEASREIPWSRNPQAAFEAQSFDSDSFDADEDSLSNLDEVVLGLNPQNADTDGDGALDAEDAFPDISGETGEIL